MTDGHRGPVGGWTDAPRRPRRARNGATVLVTVVALVAGGLFLEGRPPHDEDPARAGGGQADPTAPSAPDLTLRDLSFRDATHGWALGTMCQTVEGRRTCAVAMQETADGGRTWRHVPGPATQPLAGGAPAAGGVEFVRFAGEHDGWVFGPGLFATHDGGRTWMRESRFAEVVALEAAGGTVWLLERRCPSERCRLVLHASPDAGRTWQERDVPIRGPDAVLVRSGRSHAWILSTGRGQGASGPGLVATRDAGASWGPLPDPCADAGLVAGGDLSAVDAATLWLVCAGAASEGGQPKQLFVSATGGRRWTGTPSAPASGLTGNLVAVSGTEAWLAAPGGGLYHTTDGGRNWPEGLGPSGVRDDESAWGPAAFVDPRRGFVGYGPAVYSTADGGSVRWERTDMPVAAVLHRDAAAIYAAVTRSLLEGRSRDHRKIFLRSWVGGYSDVTPAPPRTDLPSATAGAIARDLGTLLPVEVADDALLDALVGDLYAHPEQAVRDGGVIVSLGAIIPDRDGLHVAAGAGCGSQCGWGATYVVARQEGEWRVAGTTGSMWIA